MRCGLLANALRGRSQNSRNSRRAGGGGPCDRELAGAPWPSPPRHCATRIARGIVRFRSELPADGRTEHGPRLGPQPAHPSGDDDRHHRPRIPFGQRAFAAAVSDERHDALQRLERRVDVLEQMVRRLLAAGTTTERITPAPLPPPVAPPPAPLPPRPQTPTYPPPPAAPPPPQPWVAPRRP